MKQPREIYAPVTEFERQTSHCPLYLAWRIVDELRDYFRTPIPEAFADKPARRAEVVFAHHPFWARKASPRAMSRKAAPRAGTEQFQSQRQREFVLKFMRHWLAGVLAKENPVLFRQLPESFKIGLPLPEYRGRARSPLRAANAEEPALHPRRRARSDAPHHRFVHGCEFLPA